MRAKTQQLELHMQQQISVSERFRAMFASQGEMQLYDRTLFWLIASLLAIGLIMVASASLPAAERLTGNPFHFVMRHGVYLVIALFTAAVVLMVPLERWERRNALLCIVGLALLCLVLLVGHTVNGATRWLRLGPFTFQVAEAAKLFFIVYMASYLCRKNHEIRTRSRGFIKALMVLGAYTILLLFQPDLGTVVVLAGVAVGMLFIAGAKIMQFVSILILMAFIFVVLIIAEPYRMRRVTSFMNPWDDPFGSGFQLTQSLMAFGRGDWAGQGLGNSVQKLQYLPEAHTDFIVSILGEELGFVGVMLVLTLVFWVVLKALLLGQRALRQKRPFAGYVAHGIGILFALQATVNMGAAAGLIPTKGLTLPLVSYGGTSLIVMTAAAALLLRIDYEVRTGFKSDHEKEQAGVKKPQSRSQKKPRRKPA